jgi:DNA-binding NarL/FixJ family response regulator
MTKSELSVAQLVANGLTNREVAERLFVSPHTVNTHLRQVFAKPEVKSRLTSRGLRWSEAASTLLRALLAAGQRDLSDKRSHSRAMRAASDP